MSTIIGLLVAALILVFFEVIFRAAYSESLPRSASSLPHGSRGLNTGRVSASTVGSAAAIAILVFIELNPGAHLIGSTFFLKSSVTGHSNIAPAEAAIMVGKDCVNSPDPSGKVAIDGLSYEAHSQDGYIEADQAIQVVAQDNFKLIIKKL